MDSNSAEMKFCSTLCLYCAHPMIYLPSEASAIFEDPSTFHGTPCVHGSLTSLFSVLKYVAAIQAMTPWHVDHNRSSHSVILNAQANLSMVFAKAFCHHDYPSGDRTRR